MRFRCPICTKPVKKGSEDFPFCSDRCRTIDLGNWASEKYVISTPLQSKTEDSELDEE
jgi:endogenous inhibitor of DNA gyrase (YacG/DUF329 family)